MNILNIFRDRKAKEAGFNAAYAMNYAGLPGLGECLSALRGKRDLVLRFPGGTLGNYAHPAGSGYGIRQGEAGDAPDPIVRQFLKDKGRPNYLSGMADLARDNGAQVLWVANMLTGTPDEAVMAVQAFRAQGVKVVGIELGNEWYLRRYAGKYPTPAHYVDQAKAFAEVIRAKLPGIPLGVVIPPSPAMKDVDSAGTSAKQSHEALEAVADSGIGDAYVLHAYVDGSRLSTAACNGHRRATQAYLDQLDRETWVTEWGIAGGGWDKPEGLAHFAAMRKMLDGHRRVKHHCAHNLIAAKDGGGFVHPVNGRAALTEVGEKAAR